MEDTQSFVFTTLSTDATLLALVGGITHISEARPENITVFPYIVFREDDQADSEFVDNLPVASDSKYVIDIFVKEADTYPIAKVIHDIFMALFWTCEYSSDTLDPDISVRHRIMRFKRLLFAGEI